MRLIAPRALVVSLLLVLLPAPTPATRADAIVRNPADPSYVVSLRSGGEGRTWRGTERITFVNVAPAPISRIWLRLWSNGVLGCGAHSISIDDLSGGTAARPSVGCTAVAVDLDGALDPNASATISFDLAIDVPNHNDRFGSYRGLSLLGTPLPTLAVHDDLGWHLDPFVDLGESFYSVVGDYRVTLNVPRSLATPTTGVAARSRTKHGRRMTTYEAHDVRDFEWAAGRLRSIRARVGASTIVVWYQPRNVSPHRARLSLGWARVSMTAFDDAFGSFPYPEMDVVLTAFATFGGMEYPTIVFTNPYKITVSHELAHQWWYGIVGDDQFAEPWLDESFATWSSWLPFRGWMRCPKYDWPGPGARLTNGMDYWSHHPSDYGVIYDGGGCMLANLASAFGLDRFVHILHDYAAEHWLGVARTEDFKAIIEAAAADDLPGFDATSFWASWRVD